MAVESISGVDRVPESFSSDIQKVEDAPVPEETSRESVPEENKGATIDTYA